MKTKDYIEKLIDATEKAIEFESLIAELQVIVITIEAMKWDNELRKQKNEYITYSEYEFMAEAEKTKNIVQKMRRLIKC